MQWRFIWYFGGELNDADEEIGKVMGEAFNAKKGGDDFEVRIEMAEGVVIIDSLR